MIHVIQCRADARALKPGDEFTINARVHSLKRAGKIVFVRLVCGGEEIKAIYKSGVCEKDISLLDAGYFIRARGVAAAEIKAENGVDLRLTDFEILSAPEEAYPISVSGGGALALETAMEHKALVLREPRTAEICKLQSRIVSEFCAYMEENGFTRVITPVISEFSEKPSFAVDYFGKSAVLSHSPQLYMTAATAALDRTYAVSPSFLAKKYNSTRHLNEFTSLNFQLGYIENARDIMKILTGFVRRAAAAGNAADFTDIPEYPFTGALEILDKGNQPDLDPTDIKRLCEYEKRRSGSDFVYVTGFPPDKRPFYAEDYNNFDLYFNGLKIASGSKNICDLAVQREKAERRGVRLSDFKAYEDALKYGVMPYGGCIIGLERLVMKLAGLDSVKYAPLFPRDVHHTAP